jgi:SAM-dependent methyltransferase
MTTGSRIEILAAVTIDYETWQPIPLGKRIDWRRDVLEPADRLVEMADRAGARLTFMAELGEYFWLREHDPQVARKMEAQWKEFVRRGHDVQLHLHPSWLPELGARCEKGGEWHWDFSKAKVDDYPGDLAVLIGRCKAALGDLLKGVESGYEVVAFRAGAYQAQPFKRLFEALTANGILADSSVYAGGHSTERGYDYRSAYSDHQPYFANPYDPQLKAPPSDWQLIELPIFTFAPGRRWFMDNGEGPQIARRLSRFLRAHARGARRPQRPPLPCLLALLSASVSPRSHRVNGDAPRQGASQATVPDPDQDLERGYFVMIGHTKADHDVAAITRNLRELRDSHGVEFITLSEMARSARQELLSRGRFDPMEGAMSRRTAGEEVARTTGRNATGSDRLVEMVPLDRTRLLDLESRAGSCSDRLGRLNPWMEVRGVRDAASLARTGGLSDLPFAAGSFDGVCADQTLGHALDPSRLLREVHRVLTDGGVLIAAIPRAGRRAWQTVPHEIRMRLAEAGFVDIQLEEAGTSSWRELAPIALSCDRMMYIRAWKRDQPVGAVERAREAMDWVYRRITPQRVEPPCADPRCILTLGRGLCDAYAATLGAILRAEGLHVRWLIMLADDHPRGRGRRKVDSHVALLLRHEGREVILDPMANTCIPFPVKAVLATPGLAAPKADPDERYASHQYALYDTAEWYRRVYRYRIQPRYPQCAFFAWRRNPHRRYG